MNTLFFVIFYTFLSLMTALFAATEKDISRGWRNTVLSLGFSIVAFLYCIFSFIASSFMAL